MEQKRPSNHTIRGGILLPLVVLVLAVGCERLPESSKKDPSAVLARVNGRDLTKREFDFFLPQDYQPNLVSEERQDYLNRWITTQLLYDEAMDIGLGESEDITGRLHQYRRDVISDLLVQRVIEERVKVTETEIEGYYDQHREEYLVELRVSHILVNTREEAERLKEQIGRRSFQGLAKKYSIDKHSRYGGDLGYLSKGNMIPEFESIVFDMAVGDVSGVVESEFGFHIVKVVDRREARFKLAYDDVRTEIANILTLQKREAVYDSLVTALWKQADVEISEDGLSWTGETSDTLYQN